MELSLIHPIHSFILLVTRREWKREMAGVRRRRSQVHISVKSTGNGPLSIDGVSSPCPAGQTLQTLALLYSRIGSAATS